MKLTFFLFHCHYCIVLYQYDSERYMSAYTLRSLCRNLLLLLVIPMSDDDYYDRPTKKQKQGPLECKIVTRTYRLDPNNDVLHLQKHFFHTLTRCAPGLPQRVEREWHLTPDINQLEKGDSVPYNPIILLNRQFTTGFFFLTNPCVFNLTTYTTRLSTNF